MRCCCGCPGVACSECSGTPDKAVYVTTSGISIVASGTCYNSAPVGYPAELDYSATQDGASCMSQQPGSPCEYHSSAFSTDLFSPASTSKNGSPTFPTCASLSGLTGQTNTTVATVRLASGVYTLAIWTGTSGTFATTFQLLFLGTATVSSPPCRISTPISFSNTITAGTVYSVYVGSGVTWNLYAFASGGSASIAFRKSCCPP